MHTLDHGKCIKGSVVGNLQLATNVYLATPGHLDHSDQPRQILSEALEGMFANPELPGDKGEKCRGESEVLFAQLVTRWPTSQRLRCGPQTSLTTPHAPNHRTSVL